MLFGEVWSASRWAGGPGTGRTKNVYLINSQVHITPINLGWELWRGLWREFLLDLQEDTKSPTKTSGRTPMFKTSLRKYKQRWAGHLARQCANRWTLKVTNWTPRICVRRRGRQSRRWTDELREHAGVTWQRKAQNRHRWKTDEEAFLLQWSEIGQINR